MIDRQCIAKHELEAGIAINKREWDGICKKKKCDSVRPKREIPKATETQPNNEQNITGRQSACTEGERDTR